MGCCRQLTTYLNNLYVTVCLVSRLEVSRPLLMSPLLEASPVTIKGDGRGDLLEPVTTWRASVRGKGHTQKSSSRWPSWLRSTDAALEALRQSAPGHTLGLPYGTPRFHRKELWVSRLCSISQENEGNRPPAPSPTHFSCPSSQTFWIGLPFVCYLPIYLYFYPSHTHIICSFTNN